MMNNLVGERTESRNCNLDFTENVIGDLFDICISLDDKSWMKWTRELFKETLKMRPQIDRTRDNLNQ
jgi:hypothetical protein